MDGMLIAGDEVSSVDFAVAGNVSGGVGESC